ncbi:MAG: Zn-ribbon domain-containing OB-fold protein [Gammaproteobacteria bacterium]
MNIEKFSRILPPVTDFNRQYWDGCAVGELRLQACSKCKEYWFPEGPCCPRCLSTEFIWQAVSGRGTIWSHIRMHQKYIAAYEDEVPYTVIMVKLAEGPRMYSALAEGSPEPRVGSPVSVEFVAIGDRVIPKFRVVE